ncbi:pentatricopeptide repeat-containing protein At1g11900 [Cornus florida]|uniref:pentatricopeptide repeat-containing protein At1g11900 n=1 Tax=Cornus florida TaxID=4283 RepID=UPI0028A12ADB|nr:pentatricopeptide repeat-containing protein At1g11900 [Cornus florida]XP_059661992.1 pentatricopeptide repeat-containing protein At1g11900 [Cornus florida]XP_059661993.1 pentatricopeptide repeat-containing protein At1g11900 [Cornus florida]
MLSASKRYKQFLQGKTELLSLRFQQSWCSSFRNRNLIRRQSDVKPMWSFNSSPSLQIHINHRRTSYITSIPLDVSRIWPFFAAIVNRFVGNYQSLATQASPSEERIADDILNQILSAIEKDPLSSREICTTYIEKLTRSKNLSAAAKLLQSLRDKHIFLSHNAYNLLLAAAGKENDDELISQIFRDLLVLCNSMSSVSYSCLAKAFTNTVDHVLLLRFVEEVSELTFPSSATVLNRIIFAFAECGQIDKALLIFDHMKSLKCKPELVTYNTVIEILGCVGRVDEMLHEFGSMKEANIKPDIISFNTLINSMRKVGRFDLCSVFFKEMRERGLEPDLRTYTALIESFGRSGKVEESLRLFDEMKQRHIHPSIYIYRSLIGNLKKMGKLELAMTLSEEMNKCPSDLVGPKDFKRKNR